MLVDIKTLMIVQLMTISMATAVMGLLYVRYRDLTGPGWWVSGAVVTILHFILLMTRPLVPGWWYATLGSSALILSYSLFYNGMRRFMGKPPDAVLPAVVLLLSLGADVLAPPFEPLQARAIVVSLLLGVVSIATALPLLQGEHRPGEAGRRFTALLWMLNAVMFFGRAIFCVIDPTASDVLSSQTGTGAVLLWSVLFGFGMATGPVLMTSERLAGSLERRSRDLEREVEERRIIQRRLADSEAQFRRLIEAAPFPVLMLHPPQGTILYVNRLAAVLFRARAEDMIDRSVADYYSRPEDRPALLAEILREGRVLDREFHARDATGQQLVLLVSAVCLPFHGRDCIMACASDISARKQLEQDLEQARDDAEAALEIQKQTMDEQRNFLAMVSHEFRTPLSVIDSSAEVMSTLTGEEDPRLVRIRRAVRRMQGLIETCLAHEWLESAAQMRRTDPVDLTVLMTRLADEAMALHPTLPLTVTLAPDLPVVLGDGMLLSVVLSNLIENAVKYSPAGSPVRVDLRQIPAGGQIEIRITDQGIGIAPEELGRIFEKFYRSERSAQKSGAGLGLYLAQRIIRSHGGSIHVDSTVSGDGLGPGLGSEPGGKNAGAGGTTFLIRLPVPSEADSATGEPFLTV